ncbi:MAG TPA: cupin domain-containing protein [Vicinamibacterales bacterium]|jgi:oxalate decarboxylase/phosphoglucose isomerase-like protein (cupin superfamily)
MVTTLTRWIVALALAAASTPAFAQSAAAPAAAKSSSEIPHTAVEKAITRALAELKPGVSISDHLVSLADMGKYNVAVAVVARPAGTFQSSLSHDRITEIYYVLKGSATQVTGTMVNGTPQARVSTTIGPSMTSAAPLQNPRTRKLSAGDMSVIPPGVGHTFTSIDAGGIQYLVFRIDADHVLSMEPAAGEVRR